MTDSRFKTGFVLRKKYTLVTVHYYFIINDFLKTWYKFWGKKHDKN